MMGLREAKGPPDRRDGGGLRGSVLKEDPAA